MHILIDEQSTAGSFVHSSPFGLACFILAPSTFEYNPQETTQDQMYPLIQEKLLTLWLPAQLHEAEGSVLEETQNIPDGNCEKDTRLTGKKKMLSFKLLEKPSYKLEQSFKYSLLS